ncbi:response regulator [Fluviicola taffensis]|uniref:Two component transcriptional regulator, LuxR family n=1 Tax=Fluviicola taffensis (strain DSM 16823 / NCIMB 13979 / RW262) TaxID=755732 RepID=F2IG63_FLUTR|nr:response regulator transcription factor [Fluviicola taffensis]AEA44698.1 two component transcriptional regulator, LuxR family [Fluviicola taffensis DSM 16823]
MNSEVKIKLLIVDDHQMIIDGIKSLLRKEKQFEFIAEANSGEEALELLQNHRPDILITDISMPGMSGNELIKALKSADPEMKILVVSMHNDPEIIADIVMLEAEGYILKNTGRKELTAALEKIADGSTFYSEEVLLSLMKRQKKEFRKDLEVAQLSNREIEIIRLIALEYSNEKIAEELFISKRTVETHRKNINQKTNIKTVVGLIKFAIRNELVSI